MRNRVLVYASSLLSVTGPLSLNTHLKLVRRLMWDVRADWYSVGEQLGITVETRNVRCSGACTYECSTTLGIMVCRNAFEGRGREVALFAKYSPQLYLELLTYK